ncbi:MAG: LacI family DNA-binding transcriptional regulator [Bosea sp. (in: a-proteobacteria)]
MRFRNAEQHEASKALVYENIFIHPDDMQAGRKARLIDVAREAGVSPATVSRAISQPELLSHETLQRVQASASKLGYSPDAAARALASGRSMTIGAVMPTLDNAIFSRALQAMQVTLAADGYQLLIASHDYNASAEAEAVRTLLARGIDGLMLVGAERAPEMDNLLRSTTIPVVLTWRSGPEMPCVTVDNEKAGALAAQHLLDLGHRRIGLVTGSLKFNDRQKARLHGARAALEAANVKLPASLVNEQPTTLAGGRSGCAMLLALAEPPTAIIGGIDLIAVGCIIEAQARGLSVPGNISIAGIDDLDMSAHLSPSLTTVHVPTAEIGAEAAKKLIALLRGQTPQGRLELPVELVVRHSTAKLGV